MAYSTIRQFAREMVYNTNRLFLRLHSSRMDEGAWRGEIMGVYKFDMAQERIRSKSSLTEITTYIFQ